MKFDLDTCELIDKTILDCTLHNPLHKKNRFFISGDPKAILLLQPTSPFIRPRDVSNCVKVMRGRDKWNSVQTVSLCPHQYHALNQRSLLNQQVAFICPGERELSYNKQTKDKHYVFGNVVGCRTKPLLERGEIFSEPSYGIVIPLVFAFDLDVEEDIVVAETIEKGLAT